MAAGFPAGNHMSLTKGVVSRCVMREFLIVKPNHRDTPENTTTITKFSNILDLLAIIRKQP